MLTKQQLENLEIPHNQCHALCQTINEIIKANNLQQAWQTLSQETLQPYNNFNLDLLVYQILFPDWETVPAPAWFPEKDISNTNIGKTLKQLNCQDYKSLHQWSINQREDFWEYTIKQLNIQFNKPYRKIVDLTAGITQPHWLPDARFNIVDSCFQAELNTPAIITKNKKGVLTNYSYQELLNLTNQVANSLIAQGFKPGAKIAIYLPMHLHAIAIFLGIIKAGCCVVTIAESFAVNEIATRLEITQAQALFTQDNMTRGNKQFQLYAKAKQANAPKTIVFSEKHDHPLLELRSDDISWHDFLVANTKFKSIPCNPADHIVILFSSGTTGTPKAIPWAQTSPIKSASDAYYHHNIQPNDRLCWPTSLGWMMGPWLVFASLMNKSSLVIYEGLPTTDAFLKFVSQSKTTMLGLVPSLVKAWRTNGYMKQYNWSHIKAFSSTGECSNIEDMLYLMFLANYKPIIEYCGGTETAGGYITATVAEPCAPATFTTAAMGLDFVILDEQGQPCHDGEVALVPPSIGLSNELLNRNHDEVYYQNMPELKAIPLRRHGDHVEKINENYYRMLGRMDDTMNLGGIKTSAVEIERALTTVTAIKESAAIAVSPKNGGPSQLVIFVVPNEGIKIEKEILLKQMQKAIREHLNPLFKIHEIRFIDNLPRTASNKIMRRKLLSR